MGKILSKPKKGKGPTGKVISVTPIEPFVTDSRTRTSSSKFGDLAVGPLAGSRTISNCVSSAERDATAASQTKEHPPKQLSRGQTPTTPRSSEEAKELEATQSTHKLTRASLNGARIDVSPPDTKAGPLEVIVDKRAVNGLPGVVESPRSNPSGISTSSKGGERGAESVGVIQLGESPDLKKSGGKRDSSKTQTDSTWKSGALTRESSNSGPNRTLPRRASMDSVDSDGSRKSPSLLAKIGRRSSFDGTPSPSRSSSNVFGTPVNNSAKGLQSFKASSASRSTGSLVAAASSRASDGTASGHSLASMRGDFNASAPNLLSNQMGRVDRVSTVHEEDATTAVQNLVNKASSLLENASSEAQGKAVLLRHGDWSEVDSQQTQDDSSKDATLAVFGKLMEVLDRAVVFLAKDDYRFPRIVLCLLAVCGRSPVGCVCLLRHSEFFLRLLPLMTSRISELGSGGSDIDGALWAITTLSHLLDFEIRTEATANQIQPITRTHSVNSDRRRVSMSSDSPLLSSRKDAPIISSFDLGGTTRESGQLFANGSSFISLLTVISSQLVSVNGDLNNSNSLNSPRRGDTALARKIRALSARPVDDTPGEITTDVLCNILRFPEETCISAIALLTWTLTKHPITRAAITDGPGGLTLVSALASVLCRSNNTVGLSSKSASPMLGPIPNSRHQTRGRLDSASPGLPSHMVKERSDAVQSKANRPPSVTGIPGDEIIGRSSPVPSTHSHSSRGVHSIMFPGESISFAGSFDNRSRHSKNTFRRQTFTIKAMTGMLQSNPMLSSTCRDLPIMSTVNSVLLDLINSPSSEVSSCAVDLLSQLSQPQHNDIASMLRTGASFADTFISARPNPL